MSIDTSYATAIANPTVQNIDSFLGQTLTVNTTEWDDRIVDQVMLGRKDVPDEYMGLVYFRSLLFSVGIPFSDLANWQQWFQKYSKIVYFSAERLVFDV